MNRQKTVFNTFTVNNLTPMLGDGLKKFHMGDKVNIYNTLTKQVTYTGVIEFIGCSGCGIRLNDGKYMENNSMRSAVKI